MMANFKNQASDVVGKAKKGDKKALLIAAIAAVAVIAVVVALILIFTGGPKSVVKKYLKEEEKISKKAEAVYSDVYLFANKKALKKLDMDDDDEEENAKVTWKITKSKTYGSSSDVTEGVRAFVKARKGDDEKVKAAALVEVTTTVKIDGDKEKSKEYYCLAKVGGNWYLIKSSGDSAENINDAAEKWEKMASSKKKSDD
ncbi:MAG: hypothetical protein MJ064_03085 [Lachnospiraceae bacterium]|nr:hypothetical protein [Lachnospiraceae bacterium]